MNACLPCWGYRRAYELGVVVIGSAKAQIMQPRRDRGLRSVFKVVLCLVLALSVGGLLDTAAAQQNKKDSGKLERPSLGAAKQSGGKSSGQSRSEPGSGLVLSAPVLTDKYILGPGDLLSINIWGEYDELEPVTVSAEGEVTLRTIGELRFIGLSLQQAEALVQAEVSKYYHNVRSGVSLTGLRQFKVSVLGAVNAPGTYNATLDTRVMDLISEAGGVMPGGSQRRIEVRQGNLVRAKSDLSLFLRRGVQSANPYLRDGDTIFVPPLTSLYVKVYDNGRQEKEQNTGESGQTTRGGNGSSIFELGEDKTFSGMVFDLGGLNPVWDMNNVWIIRANPDSNGTKKIKVDMRRLFLKADPVQEVLLEPGDAVYFARDVRWPYVNGYGDLVGVER